MKYCPDCQTTYNDESLRFCLQDGTLLRHYSENSPEMPTQDLSEKETVIRQKPVTSDWEPSRITRIAAIQPEAKKSSATQAVILTALTMCVIFGGITVVWLWLSGGKNLFDVGSENTGGSTSQNRANANTSGQKQGNQTDSRGNEFRGWEPIKYNASLNGENLTYYRGTTAEQCRADCDANPNCKGFTLIRAGAYNAGDPPMCYLIAKITDVATHTCCISAKKSGSDGNGTTDPDLTETFKACNYFLGSGLYDKWKQLGGENGKLGCPIMSETEAESSPQATTGRYTQFSKDDGGYIIWHGSGRFSGTSFEVSGCMFKLYYDLGGTRSWLGFPVQDGYVTSTGSRQDFEGGYILWDSKTYQCRAYKN